MNPFKQRSIVISAGPEKRRILSVTKKKPGGLTGGGQKRRNAPVPENKVISLDKRAEDEEKLFLEQFAPGRSAQAVAGRDRKPR